jgi:MYXO-CTERM domain-containing protein
MGFSMQRCLSHICLLASVLLAGAARAQVDPDPTGGTGTGTSPTGLTKADFDIRLMRKDGDRWVDLVGIDAEMFFNRARCQCDDPLRVQVRLLPAALAKVRTGTRAALKLRAGDQTCVCTGNACANFNCSELGDERDLASLVNGGLTFDTTVQKVFQAGRSSSATGSACNRDQMQNLWLWMDSDDADTDTELTDVGMTIRLDGLPPATPGGLRVTPGNEALEVAWDPLPYLDDLQGYIVFCSRGGDLSVFPGTYKPKYSSPEVLCPGSTTGALTDSSDADDAEPSPGMRGPPPPRLAALDPMFACSEMITGRARQRLYQLQNGANYAIGVTSVDKAGNASAIEEVVLQTPIPTRDFYRTYREAGGSAEGGFCSVAPRPGGGSPWLALAGALLAVAVRRRRRR